MATSASSSQDAHRSLAKRIVLALALIQLIYQAGLLLKGIEFIAARLPIDDAYYYLQVAWNAPRLGFVTFDGIHRTNGMQFLWAILLMGLSRLATSPIALLYACLALCACLNAACYLPLYRIGTATGRPLMTVVLAGAWFNINLTHMNWFLSGMENSLHALVIAALAARLVGWKPAEAGRPIRPWVEFSLLLVLNVWCRLDAAVLSAVLYLALLWHERKRWRPVTLMASGGVIALGAAVMFAGFYAMGRYPLPISGLIKADSHTWSLSLLPALFARGFEFIVPIRFLFPNSLADSFSTFTVPLLFGILVLALTARALLRDAAWPPTLRLCWLGFAVGTLGQLIYLSGLGVYASYGIWYQTAYFIFCALSLAIACQDLVDRMERMGSHSGLLRKTILAAGLLYGLFAGSWIWRKWIEQADPTGFSYTRYRLAQWVNDHTDRNDLLAAFNAGELAYFSGRRVINLDGLVNDLDYYHRILKGGGSLSRYLLENDVDYFVDYHMPVDLPEGTALLYSLPDREGDTYRVLQLPAREKRESERRPSP